MTLGEVTAREGTACKGLGWEKAGGGENKGLKMSVHCGLGLLLEYRVGDTED